ncbi:sphingosine kinase [Ascodesmis nigricans]|uniref:Sphingosine kinase n=1 Tax=Ascodesmis nigricans TaxID=341454 RepID=A0A4S2MMB3_9PEZI|nr:sphingosine kinase [Ascodesmis nigricans]
MSTALLQSESTALSDSPSISKELSLVLDPYLSLTIQGDEIRIVDRTPGKATRKSARSCCGVHATTNTSGQDISIPFYNVLWTSADENCLTITSADKVKKGVIPRTRTYTFDPVLQYTVKAFVSKLLEAVYGSAKSRKRLKVLVNPFGGQGLATKIFETQCHSIFNAAQCELSIQTTTYSGEAVEIAERLDIDAFDAVVCCSGDGVPHEVFNGLAKRPDAATALKKVAVCQLPGGSGNAMAWNLTGSGNPSEVALAIVKSVRKPIDLISITQGDRRILSFLSQSFGIIADCDLGTENLRWMGDLRFTYGLLSRIIKQTVYPCDLAVKVVIDDKELIRTHYRQGGYPGQSAREDVDNKNMALPTLKFGTINDPLPVDWELVHHPIMGNFYAGNMAWVSANVNFFPASLPHDAMFDLICVDGTVGRMKALKMITAAETGAHFEMPHVLYRKVVGYRIIPHRRDGIAEEYISIDGERIPFEPFQAEVHSGLGTVLAKGDGYTYHAPGV